MSNSKLQSVAPMKEDCSPRAESYAVEAKSIEMSGLTKFLRQVYIMMWKRWRETVKSKWDLVKIIFPSVLIFALLLLLYATIGLFAQSALEPLAVPVAFWIYVQRMVVQIMFEKSNKLQESMRMMGLSDAAYWTSYFISDGVILGFFLSFLLSIISLGGLFNDGNFGEVLGLMFVFCLSAIPFGFLITAFFDNPQTAGQATIALFLGLYATYAVVFTANLVSIDVETAEIICCFVPLLGLHIGSASFRKSWSTTPRSTICGILFADIFIYSILAWYFTQVWPSKTGVHKPFYFPFQLSYWFPKVATSSVDYDSVKASELGDNNTFEEEEVEGKKEDIPIERVNEHRVGRPTVAINQLRKSFGRQVAVNDLTFDMYENQIFALLGHNGAGKTTTINMLTGLNRPDYFSKVGSGANIYGLDLHADMNAIRLSMGVCPQHDVLFENLSVREHILLFAQLKGKSYIEADVEATSLTTLFHLDTRLDHTGSELSGGQKRKLSVAIAICGGSKFVVLDEPTAGMDPLARRELWDLLASLRKGRTMLLTTHYMDEADVLGDRIGIMSLGKMQCMGSSQFLKTTFGSGYKLIFDKEAGMDARALSELVIYVQQRIPEATLFEEDGAEEQVLFRLPFSTVSKFGRFFAELESDLDTLKVSNFGVTIPSLEDVFLKVGEDHSVTPTEGSIAGIGADRKYEPYFMAQVIGIAWRKLAYAMHDLVTAALLILPIGAAIAGAVLYATKAISNENIINDLVITAIYCAGYLSVPGLLAEFIVRERVDKLRNVLTVMGCDFRAYWLGTFLADFLLMSIPMFVIYITWGAADMRDFYGSHDVFNDVIVESYTYTNRSYNSTSMMFYNETIFVPESTKVEISQSNNPGITFFILFLFILQLIGFSYFFSFIFTTPKSTVTFMPLLVILLLILPNVVLLIGTQIYQASGRTVDTDIQAGVLLWGIMILSPHGALFSAFLDTTQNFSVFIKNYPPIAATIVIMIIETIIFFGYSYYTDALAISKLEETTDPHFDARVLDNLDVDVLDERARTNAIARNKGFINEPEDEVLEAGLAINDKTVGNAPLVINRLRKIFPPTVAGRKPVVGCQDLAFSVCSGEIFGLLGANGAGKTTTLSMLTRLLVPTSGNAYISDFSILSDFSKGAVKLGVVTQSNSLWDLLSVEDHLYLFARLRGVPGDLVKSLVDGTIDQLELTPHRKKLAMRLSGGMKRKLCVAIALIGDPDLVLLDEPSAGLDPVSRRNLWSVILKTMSQRAVVLTTHSMEEAEALCKRIGIMVQGQMRALGSKQHLKNKYGSGFELTVKLLPHKDISPYIVNLTEFVVQMFSSATMIQENGGLVTYQIPKEEMKMSTVFSSMEDNKEKLSIENYSVAQPTLEQVFIRTVQKFSENLIPDGVMSDAYGVVKELNKCGCTNQCVIYMTIIAIVLWIALWAVGIGIFRGSDVSAVLTVLGFIALVTAIVGCILCLCPACKPARSGDE